VASLVDILKTNKKLISNFSYLTFLQIASMLLPIVTYPYLIRTLGVKNYGAVVFSQAVVGYFVIIIGFGFNIIATKDISINRGDKEKIGEIVSSVIITKLLLFALCLAIFLPFIFIYEPAANYKILYLATLWLCIYEIVFPVFYFQGIEEMKLISIIALVGKLIVFASTFIFIKTQVDYIKVPILNLAGTIVVAIFSFYIVFRKHKIRFFMPKFSIILNYAKASMPVFLSNISVQVYVSTNKVLIGSFLGMEQVSYYDIGEKIIGIFRIPQSIISQTVFSRISIEKNLKFIKRVFRFSLLVNFVLMLICLLFSKTMILILGGEKMLESEWVIRILCITLPIVAASNVFGTLNLIPFGYNKAFSRTIMLSGIIFISQFLLVWIFDFVNIYSLCIITLTTEILVAFQMYYYCLKYKLW